MIRRCSIACHAATCNVPVVVYVSHQTACVVLGGLAAVVDKVLAEVVEASDRSVSRMGVAAGDVVFSATRQA
jgi:hypothetical protein